jgi:hypothetical protein
MLYREIVTVCCENNTKDAMWAQCRIWNVKLGGISATIRLKRVIVLLSFLSYGK